MARAYSSDLRSRIVNTYEQGETSIRKVAKQFQVRDLQEINSSKNILWDNKNI